MNALHSEAIPPPPEDGRRTAHGEKLRSSSSSSPSSSPSSSSPSSSSSSSSSSSPSSSSSSPVHSLAVSPAELPGILEGDASGLLPPEQAQRVRERVRKMCGWSRDSFPGGQPVSLSKSNLTERLHPLLKYFSAESINVYTHAYIFYRYRCNIDRDIRMHKELQRDTNICI
ncbi:mRNA capping enzyme [Toxoplasma gondii p89]|uniref:mRNA capping enzyme n=1 Tax=Toxoplasma gondii p89 TaxID=943119 RepID=A0A086J8J1_TOXGO|nr:mRNA capping enzyme [Toxoplasma gondii p89]